MDDRLSDALAAAATARRLLVVTEFDGTLAEFCDDPAAATPPPAALGALRVLANLPDTSVALVSGRSLAALRSACDLGVPCHLVGSHGLEIDEDVVGLTPAARRARNRLVAAAVELASVLDGVRIEPKPYGVALHERADVRRGGPSVPEAAAALATIVPGLHTRPGRRVMDVSILPLDIGYAIDVLRLADAADTVVYLGAAFPHHDVVGTLGSNDLGIGVIPHDRADEWPQALPSVGVGHLVSGAGEATEVLERLAGHRQREATRAAS